MYYNYLVLKAFLINLVDAAHLYAAFAQWNLIEFLYDISLILNVIWSFELIVGRNFFHLLIICLWWKENFLNHQKVSKYYEHGCLQNFLLPFMSLLTGLIVKNSHILAGIYFAFLKNVLGQTWKAFNTKFWTSMKISGK